MSFSPLPEIFLSDLSAAAQRLVIEVGCGDGGFTAVLRARGACPWLLDRRPAWAGSVAHVAAEAGALPLPDGSVALLIAANLLRHLWPVPAGAAMPEDWRRCLAPDGRLWILEDEPVSSPPRARHYRDAMALLARLDPRGRGPLLPMGAFLDRAGAGENAAGWRHGMARNELPVRDVEALAKLLAGEGGGPESPGRRLAADIRRDGIEYGPYWWARWAPGEAI